MCVCVCVLRAQFLNFMFQKPKCPTIFVKAKLLLRKTFLKVAKNCHIIINY